MRDALDDIAAAYHGGHAIRDLAKKYECSYSLMRRLLTRDAGVQLRAAVGPASAFAPTPHNPRRSLTAVTGEPEPSAPRHLPPDPALTTTQESRDDT
ncbi:helix-turn-helix domain-containing protein, partial [Streptomonospora nanhaiensis]